MSLPTLVIGTKNLSSWSLRAWFAFKQLGIAFEEIELPLDTPEYLRRIGAYSPTGRVPVLIHADVKCWDSLAICEYANELSGGKGWPADASGRAHARSISAEMHSGFADLRTLWTMRAAATDLNVPLTEPAAKDVNRIDRIWRECLEHYAGRGPWLFGAFSIADAMYAPVVLRFKSYGARLSGQARQYMTTALANPHLQAWIEGSKD